ncbi:hypothetical protein TNCV_334771 [Trichonephila clavipes]|nr:hypothetical protein TNCV_334771 [Trichonephila clavipes]
MTIPSNRCSADSDTKSLREQRSSSALIFRVQLSSHPVPHVSEEEELIWKIKQNIEKDPRQLDSEPFNTRTSGISITPKRLVMPF